VAKKGDLMVGVGARRGASVSLRSDQALTAALGPALPPDGDIVVACPVEEEGRVATLLARATRRHERHSSTPTAAAPARRR